MVDALADAYAQPVDAVRQPVLDLIRQLREEQLLVPTQEEAPPVVVVAPGPWAAPGLQRFSDMQDLLLLDPVHDIELDANGWPIPRDQAADGTPA